MEEKLKRRHPQSSSKIKPEVLKETWLTLHKGMTKLFEKGVELSNDEYIKLYSVMYDFCNHGDESPYKTGRYSGANFTTEYHDASILYGAIQKFLKDRVSTLETLMLDKINEETDEQMKLEFYIKHCSIFFRGAKQLNGICSTMNRLLAKFVDSDKGCRKTGTIKFHPIIYLPNMFWKRSYMYVIGRDVVGYIIKLIGKGREGEKVPEEMISLTISSILKLGYEPLKIVGLFADMNSNVTKGMPIPALKELREARLEEIELTTYREIFECPFLKDTSEFYSKQISTLTNSTSIDYVNLVQSWKEMEMQQVKNYAIHPSTASKILENLFTLTINKNPEKFFNGISEIFGSHDANKPLGLSNIREFLSTMRTLVLESKDPKNNTSFLEEFENAIARVLSNQLKEGCEKDNKNLVNSHFYINTFLYWYDKFQTILGMVFNDNHLEQYQIFKRGFQRVLKENYFTVQHKRQGKTNEFFAYRYHALLIAKNKKAEEKSQQLRQFKKLVALLPEPSGFAKCYRLLLAKRLTDNTFSKNVELESSVLEDLEDIHGKLFTTRLRRLIQDGTTTSDTLLDNYKKSLSGDVIIPFEFSASVFSPENCPWKVDENETFNICPDLAPVCASFGQYYRDSNTHNTKTSLKFLHHMSRVEMEVNNCFNDNQSYTVCCTVYQMTVLSMFNDEDSHTFENIVKVTGLQEKTASRVINALVKANLLLLEESSASKKPNNELQNDDKISLNRSFTSSDKRIFVFP